MSSEVDAAPGNYRITADRLFLPSLERRVCVVVLRDAAGEKAREKVKEDFLHIITHEMRSPLATIQGYADIIMRKLGRSSGTEKYFQSMRYSIRHLRGMVDDILNTTKLRDGTFVLVPAKISANELITRIAGQQEPMTAPKNINIVVETSPQAPEFSGDAELLERVLSAFAGNALRSTPAGGTITFGAGQDAENVIFWVRDTGPGLSEEKRAAFFDKNAPMNKYEALGFAMCGMAVELHKGRIRAESEAGKGCKLSFTIPKGPACPAL
jgi:signal transduction histidine kinase